MFYAGVGSYALVSEDNGKTFSVLSRGLSVTRIRDIALSPDEKFIFAACGYGGAWVYSVDANYWYQMSDDPIPSVDFTDVQFIESKNCVRFATYGSGVMDFNLSTKFLPVDAPQNVTATVVGTKEVEITWSDMSDNEDGFYIERAIDGAFERLDTLAANTTSYTDNTSITKRFVCIV